MPLVNTSLVSPGLLESLNSAGFYPALVTISQWDGTKDSVGSPDLSPSNLDSIAGLINLPGRVTPVLPTGEIRQEGHTEDTATHEVILDAVYSAITNEMFATIAGDTYGIVANVSDGQSTFTKLRLEVVTT